MDDATPTVSSSASIEQPVPGQVGASPAPLGLVIIMNVSVFMVILWGMMILFGRRPWDGTYRDAIIRDDLTPETDDLEPFDGPRQSASAD